MTPRVARCLECDYPLHSLAEQTRCCPECGRRFNPGHPDTMNLAGRPVPAWRRFLLRPWLLPLNVAAALAAVWTLVLYRWPDDEIRFSRWTPERVGFAWVVVIVAWAALLSATLGMIHLRRRHVPPALYRQRWWRWCTVPLLGVCTWAMVRGGASMQLLVWAGRPSMDRWAKEVMEGEPRLKYADRQVGWFWGKRPFTTGERVGFEITETPNPWCLVYDRELASLGACPPGYFPESWRNMGGGWVLMQQDQSGAARYPLEWREMLEAAAQRPDKARRNVKALIASLADVSLEQSLNFEGLPSGLRYTPGESPATLIRFSDLEWSRVRPDVRALVGLGPEAVPHRRKLLGASDAAIRMRACGVLGQIAARRVEAAAEALPELRTALSDPEYPVREGAAYAIGELGRAGRAAAPELLARLQDPVPWVRYNAIIALNKVGVDARGGASSLVAGLRTELAPVAGQANFRTALKTNTDPRAALSLAQRYTAKELIGLLIEAGPAARGAVPDLIQATGDDELRPAAEQALRNLGPEALEALRGYASDQRGTLARPSLLAYARLASSEAGDVLVAAYRSDQPGMRETAIKGIKEAGPAVTPSLVTLLSDPAHRERVADLLAACDPARADLYAEIIMARYDKWADDPPFRTYTTRDHSKLAAAEQSKAEALPVYPLGVAAVAQLASALDNPRRVTRALNTLEQIGVLAVPGLVRGLGSDKPKGVRLRCCQALAKMGAPAREALPALRQTLGDDSELLRTQAAVAIRRIEGEMSEGGDVFTK